MDEPLELPAGAGDVRAVDGDLLLIPLDLRLAYRTEFRPLVRLRRIVRGAALRYRTNDLRNDFTGALDLDPVPRPQIFFRNQIKVVKCRELHRRAADLDRLEHRKWVQRAGAADVHRDGEQLRLGNVGSEFAGDRITRLARDDAQLLPQCEPVDLHDATVDREVEGRAHAGLEGSRPLVDFLERRTAQSVGSDRDAPCRQLVEQLGLPLDAELDAARNGDRVAEKAQRA